MNSKEKAKLYHAELKKIIKKCPKGYKLCYDSGKCQLFVVSEKSEFIDYGNSGGSAMLITVGGNYTPTKSDAEGNTIIVRDGIEVNMEAVSYMATEEE